MARHSKAHRELVERLAVELKEKLVPLLGALNQRPEVVWGWSGRSVTVEILARRGIWRERIAQVYPSEDHERFETVFTRAWMRACEHLQGVFQREGAAQARAAAYSRKRALDEEALGARYREIARTLGSVSIRAWVPRG